jgi:integrase
MSINSKHYTEPKISPESHDMSVDWYVWFRFFNADEPDPKKQWVQKRYKAGINECKTLKERLPAANDLRRLLKEELTAGWNPLKNDKTAIIQIYSLKDAVEYIRKIKEKTIRSKSRYAYAYICKLLLEWAEAKSLSSRRINLFTPAMAQEYMDWLLLTKEYSGRTFNDHLIVLRTFFNCFVEREWITKNPFRSVKRKTQTVGRNHAYTDKEKEDLEAYFEEHDLRLYYYTQFMYFCFIRRTELTFIKVKHIDLLNKTITIPGESAKNNSQESVIIPIGLEPILQEMELHKYSPEDYVFGKGLQTCSSRYCNPNHISTRHNIIVKNLGIDSEKGLYSWKHSGVCKAYYLTNKDIYAIMRQLRHRDLNTTMIYLKSLGLIQNDVFRDAMVA